MWWCMAQKIHSSRHGSHHCLAPALGGGVPAPLGTVVRSVAGVLRAQCRQEPHAWPSHESPFGHMWAGNAHREGSLWPYPCPRVLPVPHPTPRARSQEATSLQSPAKNAGSVDRSCLNLESFQPLLRPASGHRAASPHSVLPGSSTGIWVCLPHPEVVSRAGVVTPKHLPACLPWLWLWQCTHRSWICTVKGFECLEGLGCLSRKAFRRNLDIWGGLAFGQRDVLQKHSQPCASPASRRFPGLCRVFGAGRRGYAPLAPKTQ